MIFEAFAVHQRRREDIQHWSANAVALNLAAVRAHFDSELSCTGVKGEGTRRPPASISRDLIKKDQRRPARIGPRLRRRCLEVPFWAEFT